MNHRNLALSSLVVLLVATALGACGSSDAPISDVSGSDASAGAGGSGGTATGTSGSAGTDTTGTAGSAGTGGSAGSAGVGGSAGTGGTGTDGGADASDGNASTEGGTCGADNTKCQLGGNALCKAGVCSPCTDTTDDANCAAAYGAANICAGGSCHVGCHDASTCAGKICDPSSYTCRACGQDADCPVAAPYCNTTSGLCGATAPACTSGTACNNGTGFCCASVCYPGTGSTGCCANPDCTNGTCNLTTHICAPTTCTDPAPAAAFYVDPAATVAASGVGSKQCPFRSLSNAFANVPKPLNASFTICTRGTFDSTSDNVWPRYVPTNVELDGTYCEAATTTHSIFKVAAGNPGVYFQKAGPASIHGYDIVYQGAMPGRTGIYVTNTTTGKVTIFDVTIQNFDFGIYVGKAMGDASSANVLLRHDVASTLNNYGLVVAAGGTADINVSVLTTARSRFSQNVSSGIWVADGTLTVEGAPYTGANATALSRTVIADNNKVDGLTVTNIAADVTLDFFSASSNDSNGIEVVTDSKLKMTNSVTINNTGSGIALVPKATNDITKINLGTGTGAMAGNNSIFGNMGAGICLFQAPLGPMNAKGNIFSSDNSKDCTLATPAAKLTHNPDCTTKSDVSRAMAPGLNILVDNCQFN